MALRATRDIPARLCHAMSMFSNGNSFGASAGNSLGQGIAAGAETGVRWPVPTWKFGLRQSDDRGDI